jgi:hypothetical protein
MPSFDWCVPSAMTSLATAAAAASQRCVNHWGCGAVGLWGHVSAWLLGCVCVGGCVGVCGLGGWVGGCMCGLGRWGVQSRDLYPPSVCVISFPMCRRWCYLLRLGPSLL